VTTEERLRSDSSLNAAPPSANRVPAAALRVPAADPLTLQPASPEASNLPEVFRQMNSAVLAREPVAATGPLNAPENAAAAGPDEASQPVPEPAEMADESLLEN
jgi:hypothetical protein